MNRNQKKLSDFHFICNYAPGDDMFILSFYGYKDGNVRDFVNDDKYDEIIKENYNRRINLTNSTIYIQIFSSYSSFYTSLENLHKVNLNVIDYLISYVKKAASSNSERLSKTNKKKKREEDDEKKERKLNFLQRDIKEYLSIARDDRKEIINNMNKLGDQVNDLEFKKTDCDLFDFGFGFSFCITILCNIKVAKIIGNILDLHKQKKFEEIKQLLLTIFHELFQQVTQELDYEINKAAEIKETVRNEFMKEWEEFFKPGKQIDLNSRRTYHEHERIYFTKMKSKVAKLIQFGSDVRHQEIIDIIGK